MSSALAGKVLRESIRLLVLLELYFLDKFGYNGRQVIDQISVTVLTFINIALMFLLFSLAIYYNS